jgi:hypothetical protein
MRPCLPTLLLLTGLLAGCTEPVFTTALSCVRLGVGDDAGTVELLGQVRAPRNALTDGPVDSQPMVEAPVAGAVLALTDALGTPLPGLPGAVADADGRYRIAGVPGGHTYVVTAAITLKDGRPATLRTLAQAASGTITVDVTLSTSLVTADLADVLNGFSTQLVPATFHGAVQKTDKLLTNDRVPDLADDADVLALATTFLNISPDLRTSVSQLKQELATSAAPPLVE